MQLYFVKATYTNNVYKLGDFFLDGAYKLIATKMLDINFQASDGNSDFITSKLTLPDTTSIRDHTHIIVPEYDKIYRINSIKYINVDQYLIQLDDDPLLGSYLELETHDLIMRRTNNVSLFRGQNDVSDLSLKETVSTKVIESDWKTGKWALLFFQYSDDVDYLGLKFEGSQAYEEWSSVASIRAAYPEVNTDEPSKYPYFQTVAIALNTGFYFQCVYDESGSNERLKWVRFFTINSTVEAYYLKKAGIGVNIPASKVNPSEVKSIIIALPLESDIYVGTDRIVEYSNFVGPEDSALLMDIKIVDSLLIKNTSISYSLSGTDVMTKTVTFSRNSAEMATVYNANTVAPGDVVANLGFLMIYDFEKDIDISYTTVAGVTPTIAEPFRKYDLFIYGKRFSIPYYLYNDIHLLISVVSGVINYIIYYNDRRNVLGAGSFTHAIKYQVDQLDSFYSQNPTYKDQYYLRMGGNAFKTVAGGTLAGGMGKAGMGAGFATGAVTAGVDAVLAGANLEYMEKGLQMKPDQIFGEVSEISLQIINLFGIYWVKKTPENEDLMLQEYYLRGFPTSYVESIDDLTYAANGLFGTAKIIFGEVKTVVRNEYTTNNINEKLKQGIILVP